MLSSVSYAQNQICWSNAISIGFICNMDNNSILLTHNVFINSPLVSVFCLTFLRKFFRTFGNVKKAQKETMLVSITVFHPHHCDVTRAFVFLYNTYYTIRMHISVLSYKMPTTAYGIRHKRTKEVQSIIFMKWFISFSSTLFLTNNSVQNILN